MRYTVNRGERVSPVFFFDKPTIRYCLKHDTSKFTYHDWSGLTCNLRDKGECDEAMWVDFECSPVAFHDAEEAAGGANES